MATTPGTYLRQRRQAAGLSIDDVAGRIGTIPHVSALTRAEWLRLVEADQAPIGGDVLHALRAAFPFNQRTLLALGQALRAGPGRRKAKRAAAPSGGSARERHA